MEKFYKTLKVGKFDYVVCDKDSRYGTIFPESDFAGSGMALCGALQNGETLQDWILRKNNQIEKTIKLTMIGKRHVHGKRWEKYLEL